MTTLINHWQEKRPYRVQEPPVLIRGDIRVYKQFYRSYLFAYKGHAVTNLAGLNKDLACSLANRARPTGPNRFLYDRAIKIINEVKEK